jgi:hypothetical protein
MLGRYRLSYEQIDKCTKGIELPMDVEYIFYNSVMHSGLWVTVRAQGINNIKSSAIISTFFSNLLKSQAVCV